MDKEANEILRAVIDFSSKRGLRDTFALLKAIRSYLIGSAVNSMLNR